MLKFTTPKNNDFQWRNLYVKQYGTATYAPPLPKNPSTTNEEFPKRSDLHHLMGELHFGVEETEELSRTRDLTTSIVNLDEMIGRPGAAKSGVFSRSADMLESVMESDQELFTPNLFDFLIPKKRKAASHFDSADESIHTITSNMHAEFPTFEHDQDKPANPHRLPKEILSLQHNAWTLLMDNRPLAWLEREVVAKGKNATNLHTKLLEIAVGPNPVSTSWKEINEEELSQVKEPAISQEAASARVFESFSPYFAVISSPQTITMLKEHHTASLKAQYKGHAGNAANMVGLPLFSQFSTWKEAYENRKSWACSPFSFFLVYDTSYNYGHISALFMMLNLILQHSHLHTAKCLDGKDEPVILEEASEQLAQAKTVRKLVENRRSLCPLLAIQKLTEDIILVFEQSASRTTLLMILEVCTFVSECVLEPEVAARFLSRDALLRQSEFVVPGMNEKKEEVNDSEPKAETPPADRTQTNTADVFAMKRFSETEFESMFDLAYWFVDSATANSRIPIDPALVPLSPHEERELREKEEMDTSVSSTSRKARSVSPSCATTFYGRCDPSKRLVSEHLYTPGKIQLFSPVSSIVEVLILYNMRRHALHKVMISNLAAQQQQQQKGKQRTNNILPPEPHVEHSGEYDRKSTHLSPTTTLLSTPLIMISTYIRLHGAPWLKHVFNRLFNVLRRESVLLYVNRLDLEDPFAPAEESGLLECSLESAQMEGALRSSFQQQNNTGFLSRMERLEDLISQDILYVINEFLSALHGKRSATRLPPGISCLISQFCGMIHLHILSNIVQGDVKRNPSAATALSMVNEYLFSIKQKQMAAKAFRAEAISDYSMSRLITTIEQFRLAKFLLFDCWIIPALNNVTSFGYVSEGSPTHLRWNIDAFARYLKILVNGPFSEVDKVRSERVPTVSNLGSASPGRSSRGRQQGKKPSVRESTTVVKPPFTLTIPRYITGIYDVSSGSLVRLYSEADPLSTYFPAELPSMSHIDGSLPHLEATFRSKVLNNSMSRAHRDVGNTSSFQHSFAKNLYYRSMDDASWDEMSSIMRGLNESLGLLGYDPEEVVDTYTYKGMFAEETCSMRTLDAFCRRVSTEAASNVVVSEFEVLPSVATTCIDKVYEMMTGTHPLVEQAMAAGVLPGKFSFSPYLSCLNGVLLHPRVALSALDNVQQNCKRFHSALVQPLKDKSMLDLVGSLIHSADEIPMVDSNALIPLLTTVPSSDVTPPDAGSYAHKIQQEAKKLQLHHSFLSTGCHRTTLGMKCFNRLGPFSPYVVLENGRDIIEKEMGMSPSTFDPWWRAMSLALCVKVMNVFSECSAPSSEFFVDWCAQRILTNQKDSRSAEHEFVHSKGGSMDSPVSGDKKPKRKTFDEKGAPFPSKKKKRKPKRAHSSRLRSTSASVRSPKHS